MYLLKAEKAEIINALEKEYRHVLKVFYEAEHSFGEEAELRTRMHNIKSAMDKIWKSTKQ